LSLHGTEVDVALVNGELDARANAAVSVLRRNPEWLDKGLMNFHAISEIPKGDKHPPLFTFRGRSLRPRPKGKKEFSPFAPFQAVGSPYILPPAHPKQG